jgi:hypothetical protein
MFSEMPGFSKETIETKKVTERVEAGNQTRPDFRCPSTIPVFA